MALDRVKWREKIMMMTRLAFVSSPYDLFLLYSLGFMSFFPKKYFVYSPLGFSQIFTFVFLFTSLLEHLIFFITPYFGSLFAPSPAFGSVVSISSYSSLIHYLIFLCLDSSSLAFICFNGHGNFFL